MADAMLIGDSDGEEDAPLVDENENYMGMPEKQTILADGEDRMLMDEDEDNNKDNRNRSNTRRRTTVSRKSGEEQTEDNEMRKKKLAYYGLRRFQRHDWYLEGPSKLKKDVPEVELEFNNISYRVPNIFTTLVSCIPFFEAEGTGGKELLRNLSGVVKPGQVLAIMGPSGAGKSTMLNILAGQVTNGVFGSVKINGIDLKDRRKVAHTLGAGVVAYVHQDDALFPMLTVEQTLIYAALLRLPTTMSWRKKLERVEYTMNVLGLEHRRDSNIGDQLHPVLSGGEKRRVTIGVEFVQNPSLIFLDEPTSGLDSASALGIVEGLCNMAHDGGRTVVMSIHQPTKEMFDLFDQVIFLSRGRMVYYGSPSGTTSYFSSLGYTMPEQANPPEFMLDIIKFYESRKAEQILFSFYVQYGPSGIEHVDSSSQEHNTNPTGKPTLLQRFDSLIGGDKYAITFPEQVVYLGHRNLMTIFQDPHVTIVRCIVMIVLSLCVGTLFLTTDECDYLLISSFIIISIAVLFFNSLESIPIFVKERAVFEREYAHHAYRASSYVISSQIIYLPFLCIFALIYGVPSYWLVGLRASGPAFAYWLIMMFLTLVCAQNVMMWVSMMLPEAQIANSVATALLALWLFFGGFFITLPNIPDYWIWFHYLSVLKYPFEGLLLNQYPNDDVDCDCPCAPNPFAPDELNCEQGYSYIVDLYDIHIRSRWWDLLILIGWSAFFRILAYISLRIRYRRN